jgi:hypothetical protein
MIFVVAASVYALHVITLPAGWSLVSHWRWASTLRISTQPTSETIARNGTVAVLLTRPGDESEDGQRLLIVRPDGTRLILQPQSIEIADAFRRFLKPSDCMANVHSCPVFERVTLAPDGTPFVTLEYGFSGAYSGVAHRGFLWNGRWHGVAAGKPFEGAGKPYDPDNVSIAAADDVFRFAFVGDYGDTFPNEDLNVASQDRYYMADISAVGYNGLNFPLGIGNATAMHGAFVAGFDADRKLVASQNNDTVAVVWRCALDRLPTRHSCTRMTLGPGIAYGIDSQGEAVGDNEPSPPLGGTSELNGGGFPVLWRGGHELSLSNDNRGAAYAISESGVIVGTLSAGPFVRSLRSGFVASARDATPQARTLDDLVEDIGERHVEAALGVAGDGRILALLTDRNHKRALAVLVPTR